MAKTPDDRFRIAVIGSGISGLSAAWLLSGRHEVTLYEKSPRPGGHSNTIDVPGPWGGTPVDMGFIVYNPETYPNLVSLFDLLGVPTQESDMSFAVSLRRGALEYSGTDLSGLFAQKRNMLNPRFWSMLRDLVRFYRAGTRAVRQAGPPTGSLGEFLTAGDYGDAFIHDHLLPMAAAIWSTPCADMLDHPAEAFLRFCDNHGLLRLTGRPQWRTVTGGARVYVERITRAIAGDLRCGEGVRSVRRHPDRVEIVGESGTADEYDHVVIAAHADQALAMLADPTPIEASLLGALRYGRNDAVMHGDPAAMPRRRRVWSSWNYVGDGDDQAACATYWMNRLQRLPIAAPVLVTLNPHHPPDAAAVIRRETYEHPLFDAAAMDAQTRLWALQGVRRTWFCGAYFGAGFHEDGLQAGLAVAEALGGVRRPWSVAAESGRIRLPPPTPAIAA